MITKQIIYNYLNDIEVVSLFNSFKILSMNETKSEIIDIKYEYYNGEFKATGSYYIYVKIINDWLISQRKKKLIIKHKRSKNIKILDILIHQHIIGVLNTIYLLFLVLFYVF